MLELLRMKKSTAVTTEGIRFVQRENSLGLVHVGIQIAENPFRLARSASCDLALVCLDRAHLRSLNTLLKRIISAPSLLKDGSSVSATIQKVENPVRLVRSTSCDLILFRLDRACLESYNASSKRNNSAPSLPT